MLLVLTQAACNKTGEANTPGTPGTTGAPGAPGGAASKGGAAPGGARGGPPSALVLGPTDVITVKTGIIEASVAISGDLRPIEEIAVRSRVEGDVQQVLVREGDRVWRGQLLARFENAVQEGDRASATADREAAKADLANAQWNADQSDELFKAGAIPERDLRTTQQTLTAAKARLAATDARLRASNQNVQDTRIVSPTTGVVSARSVEAGEHLARGATIFTVVRNDVLELEAAVPARQANDLMVAQLVRFSTAGRQLEGKVARISPTINPANRSITVYLQVPNKDGAIRGNSFATGRIIGQTIADAITVPNAAIRQSARTGDKPFVYRIEGGKVQHQDVELGIIDESTGVTQIVDGINVGDQIVVGNVGALGRGTEVRVMSAEESQRGGAVGAVRSAAPTAGTAPGNPRGTAPGNPRGTAPGNTRSASRPDSSKPR